MEIPPLDVRGLLRQFDLQPQKGLGQHFLIRSTALMKVVNAAEIEGTDTVLEVGPGLGSLTRYLAHMARRVVAVELDTRLIEPLAQVLAPFDNVDLIQGDILSYQPDQLVESPDYLVVANIPYYITSALTRHLLEAQRHPRRLVLTVQQEVAQRICAPPGKMGLLSLSVQVYGHPTIKARIPAEAFYPRPKVDSNVVRVDIFPEPRVPMAQMDSFFRLAKAGFRQKRKTLQNALSAGLGIPKPQVGTLLTEAGIDPRRRAQTLSIEEWGKLVEVFGKK